ncbi:response regulator transcription factor [Mitsuaria sp. GD03876]|uniref:response regulator transcription factor n=1 Tax=Mitsuaria sp. GD03876 TaxID=2975399 RepID=UPI0024498F22|nr:response regulator transcription factor [Mitsuaria sp. GD03876]MDH0863341.1 response regulator transcription factor [Mitsuaria sp. GD03876]
MTARHAPPTTTTRTRVLVKHPDPLLRVGIAAALSAHGGIEVFQDDLDERLQSPPIDVVISDYADALRLAAPGQRALQRLDGVRIVALTTQGREADIRGAIEAGVHGYLLLGGPLTELVEAVTAAARGQRYLGLAVAQRMADSLTRTALTSRETEVLALVVAGESNKTIARRLDIELGTVKSHMGAIMGKLGATSRTHAAAIALARGLVGASATIA